MEEYRLIGERLEKELLDVGKEKHYRDLIELIDRIADYIFKESFRVKKGIGEIMGCLLYTSGEILLNIFFQKLHDPCGLHIWQIHFLI